MLIIIGLTCGCSALKGGMPTISSNKMTPTDHQSAVAPVDKYTKRICQSYPLTNLSTKEEMQKLFSYKIRCTKISAKLTTLALEYLRTKKIHFITIVTATKSLKVQLYYIEISRFCLIL